MLLVSIDMITAVICSNATAAAKGGEIIYLGVPAVHTNNHQGVLENSRTFAHLSGIA